MKLDLIASKDDLRPIMNFIVVSKINCVATNGNVLGVVPTGEIFDEDFINDLPEDGILIHREDWKKLYDTSSIFIHDIDSKTIKIIYPKKRSVIIEFSTEDAEGKYPKWDSVIPKSEGETSEMNINPRLLALLTKALGYTTGCKLTFCGHLGRAILVNKIHTEGVTEAYGIIMPIIDN